MNIHPVAPEDRLSEDEMTALEISENKRLRQMNIDPEADAIDIIEELMRRRDAGGAQEEEKKNADGTDGQ